MPMWQPAEGQSTIVTMRIGGNRITNVVPDVEKTRVQNKIIEASK